MIPQEPSAPTGPRTGGLGPIPPRIRTPAANRSSANTASFVQRTPAEPTQRRASDIVQGRAAPPIKNKQTNSGGQKKQTPNAGKAGSGQKPRNGKQKNASVHKISRRWIIWGLLAAVLLGVWLVKAAPWDQLASAGGPAGQPQASPTGTLAPATAKPSVQPTATRTPAPTPQQVTARFLGAYFTWTGDDTDFTYADRWKAYVAPAYLAALEQSAPRLTIDAGNDLEGKSPIPTISATNVQITQTYAQVPINWTIQVLPPGGEQAIWESRHIQATVALMQNGTAGWQVTDVNWISTH